MRLFVAGALIYSLFARMLRKQCRKKHFAGAVRLKDNRFYCYFWHSKYLRFDSIKS